MTRGQVRDWPKTPELKGLLDLRDPPKNLYFLGKWRPEIFHECVAIVGSRRMTEYGRRAVEKMVPKLVLAKKTIISGFMYGVDQYAHEAAIEAGGQTVAVLGWGINYRLETRDQRLAEKITSKGGLLLSEWETQMPTLWTFPVRNRLVVALSQEVMVVEAAIKSGSLITANLARKLNRPVWAVPGPVTSRTSAGTNQLIATGQAKMWLPEFEGGQKAPAIQDPLFNLLIDEALDANDLSRKLNQPVAKVGAQLSMLTLTGQVVERGGKYYVVEKI